MEDRESMKALLLEKPNVIKLIDRDIPVPAPNQVLVKVMAAGICKSDIEALWGTRPLSVTRYPNVIGHEWSGQVVECGSAVTALRPGDRMAGEGLVHCGLCANCLRGATAHCTGRRGHLEVGFTLDGGFAEYLVVNERSAHKLPDSMSYDIGALAEPAASVINGVLRSRPRPGQSVAVVGSGPIGLLAVAFYRLFSPSQLIVLGTRDYRNALALRMGATATVNVSKEDPRVAIASLTGGQGCDIVYEAAGSSAAVMLALDIAAIAGFVVLEGAAGSGQTITVESDFFQMKDLTISGIFGYTAHGFAQALAWMASPHMDVSVLLTHFFPLTRWREAFDTVIERRGDPLKVILHPAECPG
jgi:threonine dehydrogenase-like Zn-dependent dehydrogenase